MDAWTGCFERLQKKWDRDRENGWTKKLRSLARKWNRQTYRLRKEAKERSDGAS